MYEQLYDGLKMEGALSCMRLLSGVPDLLDWATSQFAFARAFPSGCALIGALLTEIILMIQNSE